MKFKNLSRWTIDPTLDGLIFCAQRLDELVWDFTLDTHKPLSLNAPYLCQEALAVVENVENELIDAANLKHVLEELIWSVQNDPIAKSLLDLPIERYVNTADEVKLTDLKRRLSALSKTLEPFRYLTKCFDKLSECVRAVRKKDIDATARTIVTTLINMGMSKKHLQAQINSYFFSQFGVPIKSADQIDEFLQSIYPYSHDCDVYFVASDLILTVRESSRAFGVTVLDELPDDIARLQAETPEFARGRDECYVAVSSVRALDVFSAQEKAAGSLDRLSDLYTLFHHQNKITWRSTALVKQCCLPQPVAAALNNGAMEKPYDFGTDKASKELNRLIRNFAIRGASKVRFDRVADLHGICVSNDVLDNQLVTLWTSLETLIPSTVSTSKIGNVLNQTTPFLMQAYIQRLLQRFTHDLIIWRKWYVKRLLNRVPGVEGSNTVYRVLALLAIRDNEPLRAELYTELKDFHLLRYRAFQLSEILASPAKVQATLSAHLKKVEWQIRRIYRTRNMLVHSGKRPSYIRALVENAHDYFDQIIFDVMRLSCGEYRAESLDDVFELVKLRHEKFMSTLVSIDRFDVHNCAFLCEDLDTLRDFQNEVWTGA
ncbi:hypothetical protein ABIC63_000757 [Pseudacidovorax sp. 1753]|uniref:hypothetical protein n=1 Tax=Pseudacidovorax sp. 1753 TaxID=3156419 RepID=UPI003395DE93